MRSKLQIKAQKRNYTKGRIVGLRNNIRGIIADKFTPLTEKEKEILIFAEAQFDKVLQDWDEQWEQLKK